MPQFRLRFYRQVIIEGLSLASTQRVLDVGTGPGKMLLELVRIAPRSQAYGIDLSPELLRDARTGAHKANLARRVSFVLADAGYLPFADSSFDLVLSTMSLHQWADRERVFLEIKRVLKPGAAALLYVGMRFVYPGKVWLMDAVLKQARRSLLRILTPLDLSELSVSYASWELLRISFRK